MNVFNVIKEPVISEKSTDLNTNHNQVVFRVDPKADKNLIKLAVETLYPNVHVDKVRTMNFLGKKKRVRLRLGRVAQWKKAIVTLKKGSKIEFQ